jgi:NAD-dependent deacetylase
MFTEASKLSHAQVMIGEASSVVVLTGAGISTGSGIPDFRGPKGLWTENPLAEKMSDIRFYMSDPEVRRLSWQSRLHHPALSANPNGAHYSLASFESSGKLLALITQNIDGLHQSAGNKPDTVIEIHGTIHKVVCMSCNKKTSMRSELKRVKSGDLDPTCLSCGGILKSDTISFGQPLDEKKIKAAFDFVNNCDLLLCVGSTLQVYPIAGVVDAAKTACAGVVIVNHQETHYDNIADVVLRGSITDVLPALLGG